MWCGAEMSFYVLKRDVLEARLITKENINEICDWISGKPRHEYTIEPLGSVIGITYNSNDTYHCAFIGEYITKYHPNGYVSHMDAERFENSYEVHENVRSLPMGNSGSDSSAL